MKVIELTVCYASEGDSGIDYESLGISRPEEDTEDVLTTFLLPEEPTILINSASKKGYSTIRIAPDPEGYMVKGTYEEIRNKILGLFK